MGNGAVYPDGRPECWGGAEHGERHAVPSRGGRCEVPLGAQLADEARREALLYPTPRQSRVGRSAPDMVQIQQEMRKKGVTLQLLWREYGQQSPDGYQST